MDPVLLTPVEAAAVLRIGRSKVYQLLNDGSLPTVRVGGSLRVPAEELRRWVEAQVAHGRASRGDSGDAKAGTE
jgi:excisionase family DNA binding protein